MGCRHSSMDSSMTSILPPGFESQAHLFNLYFDFCHVENMKINKKRPRLAHFLKKEKETGNRMIRQEQQQLK